MVREILSQLTVTLPPELPLSVLERELIQEAVGLGPLEYLICLLYTSLLFRAFVLCAGE